MVCQTKWKIVCRIFFNPEPDQRLGQEMRQVKVFDTEEVVSESEDEHETACKLEAVDHEENYEDDDELLGFNTIKCKS